MKIHQNDIKFQPVVITLESRQEFAAFMRIIDTYDGIGDSRNKSAELACEIISHVTKCNVVY